jgi:hypothetical protein
MRRINKVLWYTDRNEHFFTGTPFTGATYYKQHMGPATRALSPVLAELQRDGVIARRDSGDTSNEPLFFALKKPFLHVFTSEQISNVEAVARNVLFDLPTDIANQVANDRVASVAHIGETIPYYTVYAGRPGEILRRDIAWATREADRTETGDNTAGASASETGDWQGSALDALIWYLNRDPSAGISLPTTDTSWFLYRQQGVRSIGVPSILMLYRFDLEELITAAIRIDVPDAETDDSDDE